MKYLSDYTEEKVSVLLKKTGAFFCFSKKQFDEQKVEGILYSNLQGGLVCPKENARTFLDELELIYSEAIKQDLEENKVEGVILRELYNHEAFYTGDIQSTISSLVGYDIEVEKIIEVYRNEMIKNKDL